MKEPLYPIVLFDADGTLFDFDRAEGHALKQTFAAFQMPFSQRIRDSYREINQALWEALERSETDKATLKTERFRRLLHTHHLSGRPDALNLEYETQLARCSFLLDGAVSVCQGLAAFCQLAIITNGLADVQHSRFYGSPLPQWIPHLFISDCIGHEKPHPVFFQTVLQALAVADKGRVLVVGDSLTADVAGGQQAGLATCWMNPAGKTAPAHIRPTYDIRSLTDLYPIVLKQTHREDLT